MPRTSHDDDEDNVPKRPIPRKSDTATGDGGFRRGVGRTKSGSSSARQGGSGKETLRGGTRNGGGDKTKSSSRKGAGIPSDISMQSDLTSSYPTAAGDVLENIPVEYLKNPEGAEPNLFYLPKMVASTGMVTSSGAAGATSMGGTGSKTAVVPTGRDVNRFPNLRVLLAAAEDDVRLHRARQQAGRHRDAKLLKTYKIETDQNWLARQQRLNERDLLLGKLDTERNMILKELLEGNTAGLTAKEATAIQLARWQRALELYVYHPPVQGQKHAAAASDEGTTLESVAAKKAGQSNLPINLDFLELLEKLMETSAEVCCD
jgi:hypothetical protein